MIRRLLTGKRLDVAAALRISQTHGRTLPAVLVSPAYSVLAEQLRRPTLADIFDRVPAGTVVSLEYVPGDHVMLVTAGPRPDNVPDKADRGPTADSE
jgi:hypothetical protein